jgi:hypothetical protein
VVKEAPKGHCEAKTKDVGRIIAARERHRKQPPTLAVIGWYSFHCEFGRIEVDCSEDQLRLKYTNTKHLDIVPWPMLATTLVDL